MREQLKEHLKETAVSFFIIVTLINAVMLIIGTVFRPEQRFGYEVFVYPLIYGAVSCIPTLLIYSKKEMGVVQMIIRKFVQLVLIVVVVLFAIFAGSPVGVEMIRDAGIVAGSIVVVFVLVNLIQWWLDVKTAERMTSDLEAWKAKHK
ncbi:MAG: hypothetical protein IKP88_09310 [Lachnospiraceae bacterium]|nr:hypothetical protein [Lachnospiraceae bacterium]